MLTEFTELRDYQSAVRADLNVLTMFALEPDESDASDEDEGIQDMQEFAPFDLTPEPSRPTPSTPIASPAPQRLYLHDVNNRIQILQMIDARVITPSEAMTKFKIKNKGFNQFWRISTEGKENLYTGITQRINHFGNHLSTHMTTRTPYNN